MSNIWLDRMMAGRQLTVAPSASWMWDDAAGHLVASTAIAAPSFVVGRPDDVGAGVDLAVKLAEIEARLKALEAKR
jgi:hypothetical protein